MHAGTPILDEINKKLEFVEVLISRNCKANRIKLVQLKLSTLVHVKRRPVKEFSSDKWNLKPQSKSALALTLKRLYFFLIYSKILCQIYGKFLRWFIQNFCGIWTNRKLHTRSIFCGDPLQERLGFSWRTNFTWWTRILLGQR